MIAPIGTTAINAVRSTQVGMSSSIVTALRMVGMILGLAALTSWALAYFRQLSLAYPASQQASSGNSLTGYANYLIEAAHTVYCTVFFISAILCLIAIIPALFLWGRTAPAAASMAALADITEPATVAPAITIGQRTPVPKRNIVTVILVVMLIISGSLATYLLGTSLTGKGTLTDGTGAGTARKIDLSLNQSALTSVFANQLGQQQKFLKDLKVTPVKNDGLLINFNLQIDLAGIHRTLPVELESKMYLDKKQNMQLTVQHVRRDGIDAGPATAQTMQTALNQLLIAEVMPAIHQQLKEVKIVAIHTSKRIICSKGAITFVLQIEATTIQGIPAQSLPSPICFNDTLNFKNILHK
ncbi:hypothetical protein [Dictyobacter kobayashii]|uniref:Uncharacterized protein n=1 Tax=Dictyobacter kobayashii TaxID=2014872 RepID=A0A402AIS6_9CHLR|nr:hypothetical protein [Dictyobacter kobayashii]GCE19006.1 hypothetical protein KDK_28060 [Dictyobacter kobayashii]